MNNIYNIKLKTLNEIKDFLLIVQQCSGKVEIIINNIRIDAKSTLSVLSLDFQKPFLLSFEKIEDLKLIQKWELFLN